MLKALVFFFGFVVMLGSGVAASAWWLHDNPGPAQFSAQQLKSAYARIRAGITPASQLARLGFHTEAATKLSYLGVMEQFMPHDSFGFDSLDPAVQSCFEARDQCTAYIFALPQQPSAKVILLIEGGRVAYKAISGFGKLSAVQTPVLRASLD